MGVSEKAARCFMNRKKYTNSHCNTWVYEDTKGNMLYRLYRTTIAVLSPQNELYITCGGWVTKTTRDRLNNLPLVSISRRRGKSYLNGQKWDDEWVRLFLVDPVLIMEKAEPLL